LTLMLLWLPSRAAHGHAATATGPRRPSATVTEAAWKTAADGARAQVLVLLHEQVNVADLMRDSPTDPIADRGQTIVQALQRTAQTSQAPLRTWLTSQNVPYRAFYIVNALLIEADTALLRRLARRPEVAQIMANPEIASALPLPSSRAAPTTLAALPWGITQINAPEVWAMGYEGQGVVVAGQDTGYEWDHPALRNQYRGWDGATADHDYNWHDAIHSGGGRCGADSAVPCDDHGHGTHTMGTIVGDDGAGQQIGVAPEAKWIGCRNMSQGVGTPAAYAECFEFFLAPYPVGGTPEQGDPDRAPAIINNSWSCPPSEGCDAANIAFLEQVIENVQAAGILVVASAGNRGPTCGTVDQPPGMYRASLTVGATTDQDSIAGFSSRGEAGEPLKPDIVAPGVTVLSALPGGSYGWKSGTSMAGPHVVGAGALLLSAYPDLQGQVLTVTTLLTGNAIPYTATQCGDAADAVPNTVYGWGRLSALNAVQAATEGWGVLEGRVVDQDGRPVTAVRIEAAQDTHDTQAHNTDEEGRYQIHLPSGVYTVTVHHPEFFVRAYPGVGISGGLTTTLDITLRRLYRLYVPIFYFSSQEP
jgi:serine protease AprX